MFYQILLKSYIKIVETCSLRRRKIVIYIISKCMQSLVQFGGFSIFDISSKTYKIIIYFRQKRINNQILRPSRRHAEQELAESFL